MCDYTICKHSNNTGNSFPNQSNGPLHTPFWQTKYKGTITCSRRNSLPSVGTCTDLFNRTIPGVSQKDIHRNWNKRLKRGLHLSFISAILMPFIIEVIFRGIILRGLLTEYGIRKSIIIAAIIYSVVWGCMTLLPVLGLIYGLWFGWLYVYSRSLWTCLITHILLQVSSVAYVMTNYYHPLPQQVNSAMTGDLWIVNLAATIVFILFTYFLYQTFRHHDNRDYTI